MHVGGNGALRVEFLVIRGTLGACTLAVVDRWWNGKSTQRHSKKSLPISVAAYLFVYVCSGPFSLTRSVGFPRNS